MTLRTNYDDGNAAPTPANVTAADMNALAAAVNAASVYLGSVASQSAMLALSAAVGDFCYRTDISSGFYLLATPASTLANWAQTGSTALTYLDGGTATAAGSGTVDGGTP